MPVAWTLFDGTDTLSLDDWGIENMLLNRLNLGVESLSFVIPGDAYAEPLFEYNQQLTLQRDGTPYFIGRVKQVPAGVTRSQERQRYVLHNAWAEMLTTIYQQPYFIKKTGDLAVFQGSWSSRVVLGQNQYGIKLSSDLVIQQVAAYGNFINGGDLLTLSALDPFAIPPMETVRDISCAEAIRRMVAYTPDAVGSFTYDTGSTILTILRRSALTAVSIDLADTDKVEVIEGLTPMYEMLPRGVVIVYVHTEQADDVDQQVETRDTAGLTTGPRVIFATVSLAQGEAVPEGMAAQYYYALSQLQWEGTIRLKEQDCSGLLRPGKRLNLLNGRPAWATMDATVQATSEEIQTGATSVTLGAADHLGLSSFVDMMRRFRERPPAGDFANTQHNGTTGADGVAITQAPGTDPSPTATPASDTPAIGGNNGGKPGVDPGDKVPNNDKATPPPFFSTLRIPFCSGSTTKIARVLGVIEAGPS